jgi:hypothetical protein
MSERDKYLTEAMGMCYHENRNVYWDDDLHEDSRIICKHCSKINTNNSNFSTWEGFGKLWEFCQEQEWWEGFLIKNEYQHTRDVYSPHKEYPYREYQETVYEDMSGLINPDRFADAVYTYLKERER